MRTRYALLWLIVIALIAGLGDRLDVLGLFDADAAPADTARVLRVVDGDTILVRVDGREERVRYTGIDTPESVKPDSPVECFGPEASRENTRLVGGERVRLVADVEARDRFGRRLAYVYRVRDGIFVNERLVRGGFAQAREYPPNTRFAQRLEAAERRARTADAGMWGRC